MARREGEALALSFVVRYTTTENSDIILLSHRGPCMACLITAGTPDSILHPVTGAVVLDMLLIDRVAEYISNNHAGSARSFRAHENKTLRLQEEALKRRHVVRGSFEFLITGSSG